MDKTEEMKESEQQENDVNHYPGDKSHSNGIVTNGSDEEDNEVITVDSYNSYSPEQIRAQMVKTVLRDPFTILTFADPEFQNLVWMANRSFTVPNIANVLEEKFKEEQLKLMSKLAENPTVYDIYIFPLTIIQEKYVILELAYCDKNGHFEKHLMDFVSLTESATSPDIISNKIIDKIKEFKMAQKLGGFYIWDSEFKQLRSEICKTLLFKQQNVENSTPNTGLALMELKSELSEIGQLFSEDQPECARIMSSLSNHHETEFNRLGRLMEKLKLSDTEVKEKIDSEFSSSGEKLAYCQHIKPTLPRNLFRFTGMDCYTDVILEIMSCLEGSRKISRKKSKPNSPTVSSAKKEKFIAMLKDCQTLVDSGIETYEQLKVLSGKIRINKPVQYPNSKPFLDVATNATATVNVQPHLWVIVAFLRIWEEFQKTPV